MYFFTQLFIAIRYQHFSKEVELDQRAFMYGNIKPDLPSPLHEHHTLENCLYKVYDYSNQLMDNKVPIEDFTLWICESIIYFNKYASDLTMEAEQAFYSFLITEGGSL